jgi:gliding motility-associated-like protein
MNGKNHHEAATKTRSLFIIGLLFLCCIQQRVLAQNYVFAQMTGAPINTTGWNLQGSARVTNVTGNNNSEILLCSGNWSSGAAFVNQPIDMTFCNKWIAEFDFRMYDGTGADGLAFCFLDVPPVGFTQGGGLGIPATANGLKVCFDTWNNCIPFNPSTVHQDMPKIEIRWGIGYDDYSNQANPKIGECEPEPTLYNIGGQNDFIRSNDYVHAKITYDGGNIQVLLNGKLYLTGTATFNFVGYLGFTASTGGYSDNHSIKNVIIYTEMPPSVAGNSQQICPSDTVQLGATGDPAYVYSWTPASNLSDPTVSAPLLHIQNDSPDAQIYTYVVNTSYKTNPKCASRDSVQIKVFPHPIVRYSMPEICLTDAKGQFFDSTFTNDNTTLPFSYLWKFGDPNAQPANPDSSALKDPFHTYSAAANYNMSLTVTNSKGCTETVPKVFTVNGALPKAAFNLQKPALLCSNQAVGIMNNSSVDFGSITRLQIFWGDTANQSLVDEVPSPGKVYWHAYPNPVTANTAAYTIRMLSWSGLSCQDETEQQITVQPGPHVQFSPIPSVCDYDAPLQITQASELTLLPGTPVFSGRSITTSGIFDPKRAGPGTDTLLYIYAATNGCVDSAEQTINVIAPPAVFAGNDTSVVVSQPLQLQAVADPADGLVWNWSPALGLSDPGIANPIATPPAGADQVQYMVRATDTAGCFNESSLIVKVFKTDPDIFVPNAFTPGQSANNIFRPIPIGISSLLYFRVYNRWGQLMFSSSRLGDGWDGTLSGKPQETGTYVWMAQAKTYTGKTVSKQGTMVLIR